MSRDELMKLVKPLIAFIVFLLIVVFSLIVFIPKGNNDNIEKNTTVKISKIEQYEELVMFNGRLYKPYSQSYALYDDSFNDVGKTDLGFTALGKETYEYQDFKTHNIEVGLQIFTHESYPNNIFIESNNSDYLKVYVDWADDGKVNLKEFDGVSAHYSISSFEDFNDILFETESFFISNVKDVSSSIDDYTKGGSYKKVIFSLSKDGVIWTQYKAYINVISKQNLLIYDTNNNKILETAIPETNINSEQ